MTKFLKLTFLVSLGACLLASMGCENPAAKRELQSCKQESADLRKETAANMLELQELKMQLAEAQATLHSLTGLNDDLKKKIVEVAATSGREAKPSKPVIARAKHDGAKGRAKKKTRG